MPGRFLLRYPVTIPLLVSYRLINIAVRLLLRSGDLRLIVMAILGWPLLSYGLVCWARASRDRPVASVRGESGEQMGDP